MHKNRLLMVVLAIVFAIALTACNAAPAASNPAAPTTSVSANAPTDAAPADSTAPASTDPIRIGVCAVLSGTNAAHGEFYKEGIELWANEVNEEGGILGRKVELVYEDAGETDQTAVNACVKALSTDNIVALTTDYASSATVLCAPEILKYEIPYIGCASSSSVMNLNNPYIWFNRMTDVQVSPAMVTASKERLGMKNPALIYVADTYGQGMADQVKLAIENDPDLNLAVEISCNPDEKQYTPYLTQIINSGADGIIAIHHQEQAALVMKQIEAMDIQLPMMGCSQYATALAYETAGESANGWYSLADWSDGTESPVGQAFLAAYKQAYNKSPDFTTVCAYDAGLILEDAITRTGSTDPAAINEAIKGTKGLEGAMTTYSYDGGMQSLGETINLTQTTDMAAKMIDIIHR
jgi:branched-chain amino acid transport system substrate-binding protein